MKKLSAILLAVALVVMACVPFCASADDTTFTFALKEDRLVADENGVLTVTLKYTTTGEKVYGGKVFFGIDADKVEYVTDANGKTFEDNGDISEDFDSGKEVAECALPISAVFNGKSDLGTGITITFANAKALATDSDLMIMRLKLKDGVSADELKFTVKPIQWKVGKSLKDIVTADTAATELTAKVGPAPTEAPTEAPTAAPTEAPTAGTTKAPNKTGEATPWALMATVAVAGAALVVLTTKKSK